MILQMFIERVVGIVPLNISPSNIFQGNYALSWKISFQLPGHWKHPLTASCLSPLSGFESRPRHVRRLPVTWGSAVVFAMYSSFLHCLQPASHELAKIGINVTKNKIPNLHQPAGPWINCFSFHRIAKRSCGRWPYRCVGGSENGATESAKSGRLGTTTATATVIEVVAAVPAKVELANAPNLPSSLLSVPGHHRFKKPGRLRNLGPRRKQGHHWRQGRHRKYGHHWNQGHL